MNKGDITLARRDFLKLTGGTAGLSLITLNGCSSDTFVAEVSDGKADIAYTSWEDVYVKQWDWDTISWGSHNNQCLPAGCTFRVYSRNGLVWREEQYANSAACSDEYPDYNPMGCQKGCAFHNLLYSEERLRYPMKRVGERGAGKWQRISWDEALTEVADAILDAHEEIGSAGFHVDAPHNHGGGVGKSGVHRFAHQLGAVMPETNVAIGDDLKGVSQVFGKMRMGMTSDNMFDADILIFSNTNWSYTVTPMYHFITEARYNGAEVILVNPDYNPSTIHADIHVPVVAGSDAAYWLSVSQVMIEEEIYDRDFILEQTDMPMLVRRDNAKFLSAEEVDGGRPDQFYFYDSGVGGIAQAPRASLKYEGKLEQLELEGLWKVRLADGSDVEVETVFARLKDMLNREYKPELAAEMCGTSPSLIREVARKVATKRTHFYNGFSTAKHYHGDLMERAAILMLGLSGNWGKPGTGFNNFLMMVDHVAHITSAEKTVAQGQLIDNKHALDELTKELKASDPAVSEEDAIIELMVRKQLKSATVPPAIWMYNYAGYNKLWDKKEWQDPTSPMTFGEYLSEGLEKGYIDPTYKCGPETRPQVLMYNCHNPLRRQRAGSQMYIEELWPKAKMIFYVETRMSSSAAFADILLPSAWYYEKEDTTSVFAHFPYQAMQEKAVNPPGEAHTEWEIYRDIMEKIGERAAQRNMKQFVDWGGTTRKYSDMKDRFTINGALNDNADVVREFVDYNAAVGIFPKDYTLEKFEEEGQVRIQSLGTSSQRHTQASDWHTDKPCYAMGWHVDKKLPYPTHTRRAQFYMDHEWFIGAGEAFPVHKDTPPQGGHHPFRLVSGHPRISVHTLHLANPHFMKLHRGQPVVFLNTEVAAEKGISDGDQVLMSNDYAESEFMVSLSAAVSRDQVLTYMWEPYQFKNWRSHDALMPGIPKPTPLAMNYTQCRFHIATGSPNPASDRAIRVDINKVKDA